MESGPAYLSTDIIPCFVASAQKTLLSKTAKRVGAGTFVAPKKKRYHGRKECNKNGIEKPDNPIISSKEKLVLPLSDSWVA